jgi:hypothetical protein
MSAAGQIDKTRAQTIRTQKQIIFALMMVLAVSIHGLIESFKVRQIWVTPDLSTGQMITSSGPYRAYFYSFSFQVLKTVWTWADSADKEYRTLLLQLHPYMGNGLRGRLEAELNSFSTRKVLKGRQRTVKEIIPQDVTKMVQPLGGDRAIVFLDMEIVDRLNGSVVTWRRERHSFVVSVVPPSVEENPYGLIVEDYYKSPRTLDSE